MSDSTHANPLREGLTESAEADPCTIVIFGASGDLTLRKLLPALYNLSWDGLLHPETNIVGTSRTEWSDEEFQDHIRSSIEEHSRRKFDENVFDQFLDRAGYVGGDFADPELYAQIRKKIEALQTSGKTRSVLFYFATPPKVYELIATKLSEAGMIRSIEDRAWSRVIVEKPFGRDQKTAQALNDALHQVLHEDQIYRIDHYLGKETVQNILVFRLGNGIFEPLWNSRYIDHVQITVAESLGVGSRAGFYEGVGVLRDMLQNHMMQLLSLVCMEPPNHFSPKAVRDEKVKVLEAIRPFTGEEVDRHVIRAQYEAGTVAGSPEPGYRAEENVAPDSETDTYMAVKFNVENWRWSGTPFYLRSGKRLPKRATEISIVFKRPPISIFREEGASEPQSNVLTLRVQPEEGISLSFGSKQPGQRLRIDDVRMDFLYSTSFGQQAPEAYERLLLDAILGDSTLFAREDEVVLAWGLIDAIAKRWEEKGEPPLQYPAGTWGPGAANDLLEQDGRFWVRL
ncbi:MAG: glucose-6-phosphate dehydrogenase [Candidatus Eisenbacteria bacterium]|uniref:Glucose-6-phosphate 1-dehydrogenase n=1 Tax=Eiseniibacteriota bacterium TaxID=2212470 RepID=A0A7Y2EFS8_UNCEI|nr:glucose-6-phosphate dehydrogenase [Candidatus Eisenbacteria bacterium]